MDPKLLASGSDDAKGTVWMSLLALLVLPPPVPFLGTGTFLKIPNNLYDDWLVQK